MKKAFEAHTQQTQFNIPVSFTQTLPALNNTRNIFDNNYNLLNNNIEEEEQVNENEDELFYSDDDGEFSSGATTTTKSSLGPSSKSRRGLIGGKRYRTQMTSVMLKVMKSIFADYKTPTMGECNALGREIGLPKRVVQVWFQNARAKEKKARVIYAKTFGHEFDARLPKVEGCKICSVQYHNGAMQQEHLFSSTHIARLKREIESRRSNNVGSITNNNIDGFDDDSADFPVASGHPIPATMLVNPHSTAPVFPQSLFDTFGDSRGSNNIDQNSLPQMLSNFEHEF